MRATLADQRQGLLFIKSAQPSHAARCSAFSRPRTSKSSQKTNRRQRKRDEAPGLRSYTSTGGQLWSGANCHRGTPYIRKGQARAHTPLLHQTRTKQKKCLSACACLFRSAHTQNLHETRGVCMATHASSFEGQAPFTVPSVRETWLPQELLAWKSPRRPVLTIFTHADIFGKIIIPGSLRRALAMLVKPVYLDTR